LATVVVAVARVALEIGAWDRRFEGQGIVADEKFHLHADDALGAVDDGPIERRRWLERLASPFAQSLFEIALVLFSMDDDEAISQPSSAAISPRISLTMSTCGAPPAVETDEPDDPLHRGALRVHGVVVEKEHLSHVIEQVGVWISGRGKHIIPPWWGV
jgi:hypothetical protein